MLILKTELMLLANVQYCPIFVISSNYTDANFSWHSKSSNLTKVKIAYTISIASYCPFIIHVFLEQFVSPDEFYVKNPIKSRVYS